MTPFEILMILWSAYQALHGSLAGGKLSSVHGTVYLVAQQTPADATAGQVPVAQWTQ